MVTPLACGHPPKPVTKVLAIHCSRDLDTSPPLLVQRGPWAGHPGVFGHLGGTAIPGHRVLPDLSLSLCVCKMGTCAPVPWSAHSRGAGLSRSPCIPVIRTGR